MIKPFFAIFLLLSLIISFNMYAEEQKPQRFTLQTAPLWLFSDVFADEDVFKNVFGVDLESQFRLSSYNSISFSIQFITAELPTDTWDYANSKYLSRKYNKFNFVPMILHKPFATGIDGFYIGLYPSVAIIFITEELIDHPMYTQFGFGVKWGYKWTAKGGFTMQIGGGLGKHFSFPENPRKYLPSSGAFAIYTSDSSEFQFVDFKIGYSF